MNIEMRLEDWGYNAKLEAFRREQKLDDFEIGRVIAEHKERYIVQTAKGELEAVITGNLRFSAKNREDFPAVGDWVALVNADFDFAIIHQILPRFSILKRQAAGQSGEVQIIAANIDYAFLVQAVDRDFNINRLERYLAICYAGNVSPVIVLSKTDLADGQRIGEIRNSISQRIKNVPVIAISNQTQEGYETLAQTFEKGKTYCMLGSSGVGKSTLLNNLSGRAVMKTDSISRSTHKGRHVTTHRELIILAEGGILVDNPGMREIGMADSTAGLETAFDKIAALSPHCKFKDCTHTGEAGCAVREAVKSGEIDKHSYENYLKLERENAHFESTVAERRRKEKIFGKILKEYQKKDIKQRKY